MFRSVAKQMRAYQLQLERWIGARAAEAGTEFLGGYGSRSASGAHLCIHQSGSLDEHGS
jgi:hypothetical protein